MKYKGEELYWIAICDDERDSVRKVKSILLEGEREPGDFYITVFPSGEEMMQTNVRRYDLVILDMMLAGKNGREIAEEYRRQTRNGLFAFCTGKFYPVPQDFKSGPYRFLRKESEVPLRRGLLETVDEMYRRRMKTHLQLTQGKTTALVNIEDILYLEIAKNGCVVHYYDKFGNVVLVKAREKPKDLYEKLYLFGFEFAHNSYLVNCHYLKRWSSTELELSDGTHLSISRAKEEKFRKACAKFIA